MHKPLHCVYEWQVKYAAKRRRETSTKDLVKDFRTRKRHEFKVSQAERDLGPSQRACEQLDKDVGRCI